MASSTHDDTPFEPMGNGSNENEPMDNEARENGLSDGEPFVNEPDEILLRTETLIEGLVTIFKQGRTRSWRGAYIETLMDDDIKDIVDTLWNKAFLTRDTRDNIAATFFNLVMSENVIDVTNQSLMFRMMYALSETEAGRITRKDALNGLEGRTLLDLVEELFEVLADRKSTEKIVAALLSALVAQRFSEVEDAQGEEVSISPGTNKRKSRMASAAPYHNTRSKRRRKSTKTRTSDAHGNANTVPENEVQRAEHDSAQAQEYFDGALGLSGVPNLDENDEQDGDSIFGEPVCEVQPNTNLKKVSKATSAKAVTPQDLAMTTQIPNTPFKVINYPFVCWVPDNSVAGGKKNDLARLSAELQRTLYETFTESTMKNGRKDRFETVMRNPKAERNSCITSYVISQKPNYSTYNLSKGNTKRACDQCIEHRRPCVRLVRRSLTIDRMEMLVYPLPEILQEGVWWDSIGYWLQPVNTTLH
ncbi:hypothetical protein P154DRAFT_182279 [Amniculicola lignicola CBS 123094]|uniref:Uncharacterized protein n=1 Tax=Amniculicola lignicola CBS 123094 TaxID=1392246 RepID=A0A6A5WYZ6_9PLEO|nr:hypothetical protein P154DRAFT_182279 [Amniculicola lignicola CBS 123094]